MRKRIVLMGLVGIAVSTLAYTGYKYATADSVGKDPVVKEEVKTDSFALNELRGVVQKYGQATTIEADFTTNIISIDGITILESFDGKYVKDSSNLYIKSYKSENIMNSRFLIAIDNEEHVIYLEKPEVNGLSPFFESGFLTDIDSLMKMQDSLLLYEKLTEKTAMLTIAIPTNNYYKTAIIYDISTRAIREMRLYPFEELFAYTPDEGEIGKDGFKDMSVNNSNSGNGQVSYISIVYKKLTMDHPVQEKWFDEKRIFALNKTQFVLKNQYKNYEIEVE